MHRRETLPALPIPKLQRVCRWCGHYIGPHAGSNAITVWTSHWTCVLWKWLKNLWR